MAVLRDCGEAAGGTMAVRDGRDSSFSGDARFVRNRSPAGPRNTRPDDPEP